MADAEVILFFKEAEIIRARRKLARQMVERGEAQDVKEATKILRKKEQ